MDWIKESPAHWDEDKQRIVGGAPDGIFEIPQYQSGDTIPGEWWRVEENGTAIGYGWLDVTWGGDAEILLAVDPGAQKKGCGTFILDQLQREVAGKGINYLYNTVRDTHPDAAGITKWLKERKFAEAEDGALRRQV